MQEEKELNEHEPTIAPGMDTLQELDEEASEKEIKKGDSTHVTSLFVDRIPED
ncbi:hypothetical protein [Paenibacillus sp. sgz302251]|uniref:hypothetical protein n=1 Tax=Paenibacillus sp. sgz302251 TaxID=3414493 RepID=UPI003C7D6B09